MWLLSMVHTFLIELRSEPWEDNSQSLLYALHNQLWCVFGVLVLLKQPVVSKYSTDSKTAPEHDATTVFFARRLFLCTYGQLQTLVKLEGVKFWAGTSFLNSRHGDVKRGDSETVRVVFQHSNDSSWVIPDHLNPCPLSWGRQFGSSSRKWKVTKPHNNT